MGAVRLATARLRLTEPWQGRAEIRQQETATRQNRPLLANLTQLHQQQLLRSVCTSVPNLEGRSQCHDLHGIGGFDVPRPGDEYHAARLPIVLKIDRVRRQEEWCRGYPTGSMDMADVTLSATPKGNGFQATVTYSSGVSISSAEAFPTKAEAISAAAMKVLELPDRLEEIDASTAEG